MSWFFRDRVSAFSLFAAVLSCVPLAGFSQSARPPYGVSTGPYRIAGVLENASTGEAVRKGLVQALDSTGHTVASSMTDTEGRFSLEHLGAAKYQLLASKRGFRTASYDEHDEFASSIVTGQDQDTTHLRYKLIPNSVLFGVVSSDDGEPVANATVMVFKRPKHAGTGERVQRVGGTVTDDTGAYEIADLASGEYMLAVTAEPWYALHGSSAGKQNNALDVVYPITYFDSTTEEQSATPIALTGGMRQEVNLSLHAVPALHISIPAPEKADGSVVMPQLQRVAFGNVIDTDGGGDLYGGAQGRTFEVGGVAPGHYQLTEGDPPHVLDLNLSASQQIDADAGIAANSVGGRVRMVAGGLPEEMTLTLERSDGGAGESRYATEVRDGRFRFMPVPPGEYTMWATAEDKQIPVIAVGTQGAQQAGNVIQLREGGPALVVTLSSAATRIEGFTNKDGKGFAGAMMVLLPKNPAQWKALTRRDQSDSDGSFAFRDVAPGEYTAVAIEDGWTLDWTIPAVMDRYLRAGINVTVSGNSAKVVKLAGPVAVQGR